MIKEDSGSGPYSYEHPRGALTVDCVVFGREAARLKVMLIQRALPPFQGRWALPGGFVQMDESPERAAARELEEETGLRLLCLEQLHTFGALGRDPRERVISIAFYVEVDLSKHRIQAATDALDARWYDVEKVPDLAFDHAAILEKGILRHRSKKQPFFDQRKKTRHVTAWG